MKRFIGFVSLICLIVDISAQKTRHVEVHSKQQEKVTAHYHYDENNSLTGIDIQYIGRDSRYQHIVEYITLFSGTPKEFYSFLIKTNDFLQSNVPDVSTVIMEHTVTLQNYVGQKVVLFYEKNGSGYYMAYKKSVPKLIKKYEAWVKGVGIPYK